jgi:hypothetical protein
MQREHLTFTSEGLRLLISRTKGNQAGGRMELSLSIPRDARPATGAVRVVEAWLQASDCRYGPVFCKIGCWGSIECAVLHAYTLPKFLPGGWRWPGSRLWPLQQAMTLAFGKTPTAEFRWVTCRASV